jgi:predicted DNA-binding protein
MYRIELPHHLLARLAKLRIQTGKPIAHQVREAVQDYCDRREAGTGQETSS